MKDLVEIQRDLKCPKNQRNAFGNYNYRSCEDILESVKPLLAEHNCCLLLSDEVCEVGNRIYIKATASVTKDGNVVASATGFAREEETKKGMDAAQITGSASSYARKYALNGLFCIDDNKDIDSQTERPSNAKRNAKIEKEFVARIMSANTQEEIRAIYDEAPSELRVAGSNLYKSCTERYKQLK